ncbi:hypothetical protein HDE68_002204 [Pedobacter cryoconitis]|uniref:Uncharacterized protein n=1 Tax=Pedobacter cryoconitis TaxID=188932 RepID=A0A7W8ZLP1_9SPHI|nr:hypothetical protein [Pedobacter cryoconitis]MBB5636316.1 hypothetical protein [Pedobacter cryoconitis]
MIKSVYKPLFTLFLVFYALCSFAQSDPAVNSSKRDEQKPSLKFGVNYLNNSVFMGRSDTARTPVITPGIRYTFKSGIYVAGSLDYLLNSKNAKLTSGDLAAGYDFDLTDNLDGAISFTKSFYNPKSTQIASSQSATINASFNYDLNDIITPSISADYGFNKQGFKNDIFLSAGISHAFMLADLFNIKDQLTISPTVILNTGTQNFYDSYLVNKKLKNTAKNTAQSKLTAIQKQDLEKFRLLDYEFSIPVEYKLNHFIFTLTPTYSRAQNKLPGNISSGLSDKTNLFNLETGIALKF